jgi:hypothetical protein
MLISTGCARTVVKTVKVDSFCEGKFESLWLLEKDIYNLEEMRMNDKHKVTIDKYIDNHTINEKEFEFCLKKEIKE